MKLDIGTKLVLSEENIDELHKVVVTTNESEKKMMRKMTRMKLSFRLKIFHIFKKILVQLKRMRKI